MTECGPQKSGGGEFVDTKAQLRSHDRMKFAMTENVRDEITLLAEPIRPLERESEVLLARRRVELNYEVARGHRSSRPRYYCKVPAC